MTESHKGGSLYAIDMRLKPSGKAGPLIVREAALVSYLENEAETWERQAYLKARGLQWDAEKIRRACYQKKITNENLQELNDIRIKLVSSSAFDLKYAEGGLLDIELFAQTYLLKNNIVSQGPSIQEMLNCIPESLTIFKGYVGLRLVEQVLHLISFEANSDLNKKTAYIQTLAALFKKSPEDFLRDISSQLTQNLALLNELDPRRSAR
jgi:glutamate-ammonia-ligase adenylyltransferase